MATFIHKGRSIYFREYGRGEPLLLIHGLGSSGADWGLQLPVLEKRFRVIVPDLPGSGRSQSPREEYSIAGFASALWALLDQLKIDRVNLVGFSMGGAVGFEMSLQRPDGVHRLKCKILLIAAEHDYTPLAEKRDLAARLRAPIIVVRGSRHATPFDSVALTNASLLALLTDRPLPPAEEHICDTPAAVAALASPGAIYPSAPSCVAQESPAN